MNLEKVYNSRPDSIPGSKIQNSRPDPQGIIICIKKRGRGPSVELTKQMLPDWINGWWENENR
ncbi:MAG: hypothetical protein WAQ72_04870 [Dethiobacteria bacterium]